jgi:rare lipoprotein A
MQSGGHGVPVPRVLAGPGLTTGSGGCAPQPPFGTFVQVTVIETGQSIVVRINDRGRFGRGRIIDLSRAAADLLGIRHAGMARVRLEPAGSAGADEGCPFQQARSD